MVAFGFLMMKLGLLTGVLIGGLLATTGAATADTVYYLTIHDPNTNWTFCFVVEDEPPFVPNPWCPPPPPGSSGGPAAVEGGATKWGVIPYVATGTTVGPYEVCIVVEDGIPRVPRNCGLTPWVRCDDMPADSSESTRFDPCDVKLPPLVHGIVIS